jgi:hypothetical protein
MKDSWGDWRIQAVVLLAKDLPATYPGGPSHKAGTPIHLATSTRGTGDQPLGFVTPNSTALALNIAMSACIQSPSLFQQIVFDDVITPEGPGKSVSYKNIGPLFDYFELCMVTITFSFQSLETFCNWEIADKVKGTFTIRRDGVDEIFTVDEMERRLSTEEKLGSVIPKLLSIPSPKGKKVWQDFKKLKHARDSIVHFKSLDQYPNRKAALAVDKDSLYFVFLNNNMTLFPIAAIKMLHHFFPNPKDVPRWLETPIDFSKQK